MAGGGSAANNCTKCGKRKESARAGSLTGYLFQNFNCQCDRPGDGQPQRQLKKGADADFCPRCGLRKSAERAGSITSFMFQDIRCKCAPEADFSEGSMRRKLTRLKQLDQEGTFIHEGDEAPIAAGAASAVQSIGLAKGAIIGSAYKIKRLLGRGAMGEVYLAEHTTLNKRCALKVIPPEQLTEAGWMRFQTEARTVSKLEHPNLVKVLDLGIQDGCLPYFAMEYVDGRTMSDLLEAQGPMPLKTALAIFDQVCEGLDCAHRNGVIHRDLKPANIMLRKESDGQITAKILDFGLVKLTNPDREKQSLTAIGEMMGSPFYMSPEQCLGDKIDRRSDIYSLGCTLFECLVGRPPFNDEQPAAIVQKHLESDPPSLEKIVGAGLFPDAMEVVIAKLLRKNPVERYQSMAELRSDLLRVSRGESVKPFYVSRTPISKRVIDPELESSGINAAGRGQKLGPNVALLAVLTAVLLTIAFYFISTAKTNKTTPAGNEQASATQSKR